MAWGDKARIKFFGSKSVAEGNQPACDNGPDAFASGAKLFSGYGSSHPFGAELFPPMQRAFF